MSIFSQNKRTKLRTNTFDLSHDRKFSMKFGYLTPMFLMDTVPGDRVTIQPNLFLRFAPLIAPVMHQVTAYMHFFFVPNRILLKEWEQFITGGENGLANPTWPYVSLDFGEKVSDPLMIPGSLADYLGLPVNSGYQHTNVNREVSAFPFAAYQAVYNDYYRDENLITPVKNVNSPWLTTGSNTSELYWLAKLRKRAWQHDYFTSALPWTQRGPIALLPLGDDAPIVYDTDDGARRGQVIRYLDGDLVHGGTFGVRDNITPPVPYSTGIEDNNPAWKDPEWDNPAMQAANLDLKDSHYVDLSAATAATIEDLRRAFKLQEYLEKMARGGARYTEYLKVIFGVSSLDYRLQRPEFIGGTSVPIKISEVLQNAPATDEVPTPQGTMAGHAIGLGSGRIKYYCPEHGYIIGLLSVMPKTAYQQGIPRHFWRTDRFEYFTPDFQHIGEQAIYNRELYQGADPGEVFGYIPRYSEYKYIPSSVHGDFRGSLDFWHMGRKFDNQPLLNKDFIEMDEDEIASRIFAVDDNSDYLWCQVFNQVKARRPMAYFGNPQIK